MIVRLIPFLALLVPSALGAHPQYDHDAPTAGSITVMQRSAQPLPGAPDLMLSIGDITANQTVTQVDWRDGVHLLGPLSMRQYDTAEFVVAGERWRLTLVHLHNEFIGNDWARFDLAPVAPSLQQTAAAVSDAAMTPAAEIKALIEAVEGMKGGVFLRNGEEHSAAEAGKHLRRKLKGAGGRIQTAEQFIEHIASKSERSGNPYAMRLPNGKIVDAGEWFRARLAGMRAGKKV